ncbi:MAG TPA: cyclic pyranopterin monophosphate synthase MoaC [Anseongella sp.]|nr:cyclic pyranopterin monophosphate synthase MoaC [Anseongella sp.]
MAAKKNPFTHLSGNKEASMVSIGDKSLTQRTATAECRVLLPPELQQALKDNELYTPKGAVFETARLAGIMAVKKTADLIPLCHTILIEKCSFSFGIEESGSVLIRCTVGTTGKTGVEMEALTGAGIAALTIYDMCKAVSHDIVIGPLQLAAKSGGKRDFSRDPQPGKER